MLLLLESVYNIQCHKDKAKKKKDSSEKKICYYYDEVVRNKTNGKFCVILKPPENKNIKLSSKFTLYCLNEKVGQL